MAEKAKAAAMWCERLAGAASPESEVKGTTVAALGMLVMLPVDRHSYGQNRPPRILVTKSAPVPR